MKGVPHSVEEFFPRGILGLWSALIFGFYAFGGIEIMGIMATRLKDKRDAPSIFTKKGFKNILFFALAFTSSGLGVSILMSFLMPDRIYEYITTAAGLMFLYNWLLVLNSAPKLLD